MAIMTRDFRGEAHQALRLVNYSQDEITTVIRRDLPISLQNRGINAHFTENVCKSGLLSQSVPIFVVHCADSGCRYFDIGFVVNGNIVSFPFLGESAENTKMNRKKMLEKDGSYLRAAFISVDEFALQQEEVWVSDVIASFMDLLE